MKIKKGAPTWTTYYETESEYGRLECVFYPEQATGHFYEFFSAFAESTDDYLSKHPSFEKYADHATKLFAELFPQRLKALMEETVNEARLRTLIEVGGLTPNEAKTAIREALKVAEREQKRRMNAPKAGRPNEWDKATLKKAVEDAVSQMPLRRNVTLSDIAKKLKPPTSEDALRKLLKRHRLEWKELKKRT